jgi:predicted transcriptional regulator
MKKRLSELEQLILGLLITSKPATVKEIKFMLKMMLFTNIAEATIYRVCNQLVKKSLVQYSLGQNEKGNPHRLFTATKTGQIRYIATMQPIISLYENCLKAETKD